MKKIRPLTETKTEVKMVIDESTMTILNRLRELLSHKMPHATYAQLLDYLAREKVATLEKKLMGTSKVAMNGQVQEKINPEQGIRIKASVESKQNNQGNDAVSVESLQSGTVITPPTGVGDQLRSGSTELKAEVSGSVYNKPVGGSTSLGCATPRVYISVVDRRWVMNRATGQCEYVSGHGRCRSRYIAIGPWGAAGSGWKEREE